MMHKVNPSEVGTPNKRPLSQSSSTPSPSLLQVTKKLSLGGDIMQFAENSTSFAHQLLTTNKEVDIFIPPNTEVSGIFTMNKPMQQRIDLHTQLQGLPGMVGSQFLPTGQQKPLSADSLGVMHLNKTSVKLDEGLC